MIQCGICNRVLEEPMSLCSNDVECPCGQVYGYANGYRTARLSPKQMEVLTKYQNEWSNCFTKSENVVQSPAG